MNHRMDNMAVTRGSAVLRAFERGMEHGIAAWRTSWFRAAGVTAVRAAASAADPVALAGWMVLGAAVMRLLLAHGRVGVSSSSAAGIGWVLAVPFALGCIRRPAAVRSAWRASRLRASVSSASKP